VDPAGADRPVRRQSTLGKPKPVTVRWEIADDEAFHAHCVQSGQAQALAELAHSVHVRRSAGLASRTAGTSTASWQGDAVSPVGRTRTFPAPDAPAARLRLAYASLPALGAWLLQRLAPHAGRCSRTR
jgi:phosphodiesterase/alkaline phosphatase D-like protein